MSIDRNAVIDAMSRVKARSNGDGLIPAFNVLVNEAPTTLWNNFADLITNSVSPDLKDAAQCLLVNAAHECGYHTGYGIITSEEWDAIVAPMIEKVPDDVLHGAYAVFTAWGWAKSEIVELVPGERMVVRAYDYYEADVVEQRHVRHEVGLHDPRASPRRSWTWPTASPIPTACGRSSASRPRASSAATSTANSSLRESERSDPAPIHKSHAPHDKNPRPSGVGFLLLLSNHVRSALTWRVALVSSNFFREMGTIPPSLEQRFRRRP